MARYHPLLGALALVLPVAVEIPASHRDTSETRVSLMGGAGSYALIGRGCEGEILSAEQVRFREAGAAVEHKTSGPWRLGLRAGVQAEEATRTNAYVNPNLSLDWRFFSVGAGYFESRYGLSLQPENPSEMEWPNPTASGHLRIGSLNSIYVSGEVLESVPLYAGGGFVSLGVGARPAPNVAAWVGLNAGPYDGAGVALRSEFRISPQVSAQVRARFGSSEGIGENAVAVGLTYRLGVRTPRP